MARLPRTGVARLIDAAARFAARQPAIAGWLGAASSDAELERVREGVFFLGAAATDQVRRFEGDGYSSLADIAAPDLARPFPAATILELRSKQGPPVRVHDGAEVCLPHNESCRFRVVGRLDVAPVEVENCRVELERRLSVRFDVVGLGGAPLFQSVGRSLRIYIDEPRDTALLLLAHLASHALRVELRRQDGVTFQLQGLRLQGFGRHDALAPDPDGGDAGASLVREYFLLPERFLLFDVRGIAAALDGRPDTRATIIVRFDEPLPQRVLLSPQGLRANCAAAVNLFPATAEPCVFELGQTDLPLRVAEPPSAESGPYAVLRVAATDLAQGRTVVDLPSLRRFGAGALAPAFPYAYRTKLVTSPGADREPETILALTPRPETPPVLEAHVISVDLLATNRHLGSRVRPGELSKLGPGMPPGLTVRNIAATSPYAAARTGPAFALRTFARAQVPRTDPLFALQSLLYALVPDDAVEKEGSQALRARVRAIESLDVEVVENVGRTRRGYRAILRLDETPFNGLGDVSLFARVLHALLDTRASVNRFFVCEALCIKSGARVSWPPQAPA